MTPPILGNDLAVRLPRTYDPERLKRDLEALRHIDPARQPGPYHDGEWRGIALYAQGGRQSADPGCAGLDGYLPTEALACAPYMAAILGELAAPKRVVRLLALPPGGVIREHADAWANFQCGTLRLHVPVVTNPGVVFVLDGTRVTWNEGELWWGDFSRNHHVRNDGSVTRVHLVIDVEIDDSALGLFPQDFVARREAEGAGITRFRAPVELPEADLAACACRFHMPGEVMPLFGAGRGLAGLVRGARGELRVLGGRLVAHLDGRPAFALRGFGGDTFGVVGQTAGVTLHIARSAGRVVALELVLRGLPEDLYAAQMGYLQGPLIPQRRIPLPRIDDAEGP